MFNIVICAVHSKTDYSGGRYHSWMMSEALASQGHEVTIWTNNIPVFFNDFCKFPAHESINIHLSQAFQHPPAGPFDVVVVVPHLGEPHSFFYNVLLMAQRDRARTVLLNFESPNWFNELSPEPRNYSLWWGWVEVSRVADLILSSAAISTTYAKKYYVKAPTTTLFRHCYPSINSITADEIEPIKKRKQIICITRFAEGHKHKGGKELLKVIGPSMANYDLAIIIGTEKYDRNFIDRLLRKAAKFNIRIRILDRLNDHDKFKEIKQSELMLFLSYFEGFGYPPVEALHCDIPCIAYDLPVLREVSGDALIYVPNGDIIALHNAVAKVLSGKYQPTVSLPKHIANITSFFKYSERLNDIIHETMALQSKPSIIQTGGKINLRWHYKSFMARLNLQIQRIRRLLLYVFFGIHSSKNIGKIPERFLKRFSGELLHYYNIKIQKIKSNKDNNTVTYFPRFSSIADLENHYHRACWYLPRFPGKCENIYLFHNMRRDLTPGVKPEHMCSPQTATTHISLRTGYYSFVKTLFRSRLILVWKNYNPLLRLFMNLFGIRVTNIDTNDVSSNEYGTYCNLIWLHFLDEQERETVISANYKRFCSIAQEILNKGYRRSCVFGTGPSLENAIHFSFKDSLTIICNSIVQEPRLLEHVSPKFICAGDVVSHHGVSSYAEAFRKDLIDILLTTDTYFVTTASFGYLLLLNHPEITEKTILIEQTTDLPNYNLIRNFGLPRLDSTLNIHMLPLASTFTDEIFIIGCDGKVPNRDNEDFWAHAKHVQYYDLVWTGHKCHPTFDANRQRSTYHRFLESIEQSVSIGETKYEKKYLSLCPSNIPALETRLAPVNLFPRNR